MERLSEQIISGLSLGWRPIGSVHLLPDHTSIIHAATNGFRRLIFLLVDGPVRSAMPLFELNTKLRQSGVEPFWLFQGMSFPSTTHMVCAAVEWKDGLPVVSIMNSAKPEAKISSQLSLLDFTRAASEQRLKAIGFAAGQFVDVTVTADECRCSECGAVEHKLEQAIFYPLGERHSPGLELTKVKLGRAVSKLIENAISELHETNATLCPRCKCRAPAAWTKGLKVTKSIAGIQLSSLAALELIRFHKTAWYIG